MRSDLKPLPDHMKNLPIDDRGYPVPWFVDWIEGHHEFCDSIQRGPELGQSTKPCNCGGRMIPEFRAMDREKFVRALRGRLCWVCGGQLGVHYSFVAGPMCGINRTSAEPPSHLDCAQWSAINCPFLSNPRMVRREDDAMNNPMIREQSADFGLTRNPGVAMVYNTRSFEAFKNPRSRQVLITMGPPESVEWYAEGRTATREEVLESIAGGLPSLEAIARTDPDGIKVLREYQARFEKWIPAR